MSGPISTKSPKDQSAEQAKRGSFERVLQPAGAGPKGDALALQDAAGNRAAGQMLRPIPGNLGAASTALPPVVTDVLRSPGQPLALSTRSFMESRFGYDFSQVRVHTDAVAAGSAKALRAKAYSVGHDLVFGDGGYAPGSSAGQRLLAHELTHVVQVARSGKYSSTALSQETDPSEQEATALSNSFTSGSGSPLSVNAAPSAVIHRYTENDPTALPDVKAEELFELFVTLNDDHILSNGASFTHRWVYGSTGTEAIQNAIRRKLEQKRRSNSINYLDWYLIFVNRLQRRQRQPTAERTSDLRSSQEQHLTMNRPVERHPTTQQSKAQHILHKRFRWLRNAIGHWTRQTEEDQAMQYAPGHRSHGHELFAREEGGERALVGMAFLDGLNQGLRRRVGRRVFEDVTKAGILQGILPQFFAAGVVVGLGDMIWKAQQMPLTLLELWEQREAIEALLEKLLSPEGAVEGYRLGLRLGLREGKEITEKLTGHPTRVSFQLGRMAAPIILDIILMILTGSGEIEFAGRIFRRLAKRLGRFLRPRSGLEPPALPRPTPPPPESVASGEQVHIGGKWHRVNYPSEVSRRSSSATRVRSGEQGQRPRQRESSFTREMVEGEFVEAQEQISSARKIRSGAHRERSQAEAGIHEAHEAEEGAATHMAEEGTLGVGAQEGQVHTIRHSVRRGEGRSLRNVGEGFTVEEGQGGGKVIHPDRFQRPEPPTTEPASAEIPHEQQLQQAVGSGIESRRGNIEQPVAMAGSRGGRRQGETTTHEVSRRPPTPSRLRTKAPRGARRQQRIEQRRFTSRFTSEQIEETQQQAIAEQQRTISGGGRSGLSVGEGDPTTQIRSHSRRGIPPRPSPGPEPRHLVRGNFVHRFAKYIFRRKLPALAEREVTVQVSHISGETYRIDLLVRGQGNIPGEVIEIRPTGPQAEEMRRLIIGRAQAVQREIPHPAGYSTRVLEYTFEDALEWLTQGEGMSRPRALDLMEEYGFDVSAYR